jgi:arsenate reductase-like glutaredoxin family protein
MFSRQATQNARFAAHCARRPAARVANPQFRAQKPRFQSTESTTSGNSGAGSHAAIGAVSGAAAALTVGYIFYRQSGARDVVVASKTAKGYVTSATQKIKEQTPEPNEALQWLRNAAQSYAAFIPGAKTYVDSAFDDLDAIREKHGEEVDAIVREAYDDMRKTLGNGDMSLVTAHKTWDIITKHMSRIADLAGDASQQIMDNHPQLKEKLGGNVDKLKEYGDKYGPEAKKEVDRTWNQVSDVVKTGMSAANIEKIRSIVQEKVEKLKKMGDEAWDKGMEQAKPYLDKNPQVKKLVEENADALKGGDVQQLYQRVKSAVEKGDMGDLESYVKSAANKAKDAGFGDYEKYLKQIPGGDQILPKLSQLQEVAQKHGDEAQKLLKDAVSEISDILQKKGDEASKLAEKAKQDSKK